MGADRNAEYADMLWRYRDHVRKYRDITYEMETLELPQVDALHKWVGAQAINGKLYAFPNDMYAFLCYDLEKQESSLLGDLGKELFKWTGGCIWQGHIYAFPRSSNDLLKLDPKTGQITRIFCGDAGVAAYPEEHHYGGVCTEKGIVYQPPRGGDHLLVWDLRSESCRTIPLAPPEQAKKYRYCGSVIHPSGYVYFIPESDAPVIKMDPETEEWCFIGEEISARVFDAKVAADGNIYGFSAYDPGILKITVESDRTEMIHTEIRPAAYGTKIGINGKLYSVPGDGQFIWEYDPSNDTLQPFCDTGSHLRAKYAGGVTLADGTIIMVPPQSPTLCVLKPKGIQGRIEEKLHRTFWMDNY